MILQLAGNNHLNHFKSFLFSYSKEISVEEKKKLQKRKHLAEKLKEEVIKKWSSGRLCDRRAGNRLKLRASAESFAVAEHRKERHGWIQFCILFNLYFLCTCRSAKQKLECDLTWLYVINSSSCVPERLTVIVACL